MNIWFAYGTAWISTAAAAIAGIYFTHSPWCLWVFAFPVCIELQKNNSNKGKDNTRETGEQHDKG